MTSKKLPPYPPRRSEFVSPGQVPRPVFGLDIDGTMGVYHGHFLNFAEGWLGREMRPTYEFDGSESLAAFMGVSKATYRRVKLAYRQGGLKRSMPAYPGASELTRALRARGALVVICTTRPYLALSNIEPDTREWARRNGIQYDGFIFGEHKYRDLVRMVGASRIVGVLDDLPEMYEQASRLGLPTLLRMQPYNEKHPAGHRVSGLHVAREEFLTRLDNYEKEHQP